MKLSIIVGVHNQLELARETTRMMLANLVKPEETEIIVIDNASTQENLPIDESQEEIKVAHAKVVRNEGNSGNYPLFQQGCALAKGEIVAFIHSDVFIYQKGWDSEVIAQFDRPEMGLVGFIGSTELDSWGGRGVGTVSNMQGRTVGRWHGSAGHIHGKVSAGMTVDGSVVDGCVMIFRKSVLEQVPFRENYPPHHFYDRLLSCQVLELGHKVGILGIEFDHVSGQTANQEPGWQHTSAAWFKLHMDIDTPQQWAQAREEWVKRGRNNPSAGKVPDQWDYAAYLEAEYQFLKEYRDEKHLVPLVMGKRV